MKKSFLTIVCTFMALGLWASPVTPEMAKSAANAWARKNAPFGAKGQAGTVRTVRDANAAQTVLWYEVAMSNGGLLVIAPVTEIEPVVAALDNAPSEFPEGHVLPDMLKADMRARLKLLGLYKESSSGASFASVVKPSVVAPEVAEWVAAQKSKWAKLGIGPSFQEAPTEGVDEIAVQVGIVDGFEKGGRYTHWNQGSFGGGYCYNYHTPGHAVCGCVATAAAAVMQYFAVTGAVPFAQKCSYNGKLETYEAIGGTYDWNILPVKFGGTNETDEASSKLGEAERELLGRVAYDSGVGVGMMWTDGESGAVTMDIAESYRTNFGFKDARAVNGLTAEQYDRFIYNQCRAGAPVILSIRGETGGHAVVAAGFGLDSDGVERVRIFCGWGGSGDAWYALPNITTKSTAGGVTARFDLVNGAVTMIGYDSDETVPVVGQVTLPGATIEMPGVPRTVNSDGNGYFATRVSPLLANTKLICSGKENTGVVIGEAAQTVEDPESLDDLYQALPESIDWPLLNMLVAFNFDDAKRLALESGRAILRISGTSGESNTTAIVDRIYEMDDVNEGDITNRFVYFFSSFNSGDPTRPDGNPSYGVFLPQKAETDGRWMYNNGRLTYGFALTTERDIEEDDEDGFAQIIEVTTNALVFTAIQGQESVKTVFENGTDDEIQEAILASLQQVMDQGWELYLRATSDIRVTVTSSGKEAGTPEPMYGVHTTFTNGETVVATSYAEITNEIDKVVLGCSGWTLTNETTGAFQKGAGNTAEFVVASNDVCTLTWQMDKTNAVYIAVRASDEDFGTISPESGWYPYGKAVTFTVTPSTGWMLSNWIGDGESTSLSDAVPMGQSLGVPATMPGEYVAQLRRGATPVVTEMNTLTVVSFMPTADGTDWELVTDANVPATLIRGLPGFEDVEIPNSASADLPATSFGVCMSETAFTTADGTKMELYAVSYGNDVGYSSIFGLNLNAEEPEPTVFWYWIPAEEDVDEFVISWNDTLDNLSESYTTNLLTNAQFEAMGKTLEQLKSEVVVPKGWKANLTRDTEGNVVASLLLDEETLAPVAPTGEPLLTILPNGDGSVTVKASIANGVKGFWYSLVASDDLAAWKAVASGEYDSGTPSEQALQTQPVELSIDVTPADAKKFYKIVVTVKNPVTE